MLRFSLFPHVRTFTHFHPAQLWKAEAKCWPMPGSLILSVMTDGRVGKDSSRPSGSSFLFPPVPLSTAMRPSLRSIEAYNTGFVSTGLCLKNGRREIDVEWDNLWRRKRAFPTNRVGFNPKTIFVLNGIGNESCTRVSLFLVCSTSKEV